MTLQTRMVKLLKFTSDTLGPGQGHEGNKL